MPIHSDSGYEIEYRITEHDPLGQYFYLTFGGEIVVPRILFCPFCGIYLGSRYDSEEKHED